MVTAPANTGITITSRKAVINQVQTNSGIFIRVMPSTRRLKMVTMMLMAPSTDEIPIKCTPMMKKSVLGGP